MRQHVTKTVDWSMLSLNDWESKTVKNGDNSPTLLEKPSWHHTSCALVLQHQLVAMITSSTVTIAIIIYRILDTAG
jgi:hypothetical protein